MSRMQIAVGVGKTYNKQELTRRSQINATNWPTVHHGFYGIFRGLKIGYKNRDLAIKTVIACIISIFGAKKVAIKTVMDCPSFKDEFTSKISSRK